MRFLTVISLIFVGLDFIEAGSCNATNTLISDPTNRTILQIFSNIWTNNLKTLQPFLRFGIIGFVGLYWIVAVFVLFLMYFICWPSGANAAKCAQKVFEKKQTKSKIC